MKWNLMIGRYQPFHAGHRALVDTLLSEGKNVLIAVRDTGIDDSNPFPLDERIANIANLFAGEERVRVIGIPDIEAVVYGRGVGYEIRELRMPDEIESISATKIREAMRA